jgi:hypothetical protein
LHGARGVGELWFEVLFAVKVFGFAIDARGVGLVAELLGLLVTGVGFLLELVDGPVLEGVTDAGDDSSAGK